MSSTEAAHGTEEQRRANATDTGVYNEVVATIQRCDVNQLVHVLQSQQNIDFLWKRENSEKKTIFHLAAELGSTSCLSYLAKRGGSRALVARDKDGWTPLHYAAHSGQLESVKVLIMAGSPILRDDKGKTPMYWCGRRASDLNIVSFLLDATLRSGATSRARNMIVRDSATYAHVSSTISVNKTKGTTGIGVGDAKISATSTNRIRSSLEESVDEASGDFTMLMVGNDANSDRTANSVYNAEHQRTETQSTDDKNVEVNYGDDGNETESEPTANMSLCKKRNPRAEVKSRRQIGRRSSDAKDRKEEGSWTNLHLFVINSADEMELENLCLKPNIRNNVNAAGECGLTPLHMAAIRGNIIFCEVLLNHGAYLCQVDSGGKTALHRAAQAGRTMTVKYFLEKGININAKDNDGRTPLHDAAYNGHVDAASILIQNGATCDEIDIDGSTALLLAAHSGHVDMVDLLLHNGVDADKPDLDGCTALHDAAEKSRVEVAKILLEYNARLDVRNECGRTALHAACAHGHYDVAKTFVDHILITENAEQILNARDEDGWSALHDAVVTGNIHLVRLLVENGLDVNEGDQQPPLHGAAANGHAEVVRYLMGQGARTNEGDSNGDTALHWAAFKGQSDCVRALLEPIDDEPPIDPHCQNADGGTALHSAANHGDVFTGKILLEHGANVDIQMDDGNAALHNAAYEGHHNFALSLLEHGANVNILNAELRTPLHEAACMGHTHLCRLLLNYGAGIDVQDGGGDTALHWAVCNGHSKTAFYLLQAGANMASVNVDGGSPLHAALINGEEESVRVLIKAGANVNAKMETPLDEGKNDSCLHVAAAEGLTTCITLLISAGALFDEKDGMGRTPLHEAVRRRHISSALSLISNGADLGAIDFRGCVPLQYALGRRPDLLHPLAKKLSSVPKTSKEWTGFSDMLDNEQFSDVIIVCRGGEEMHAHKVVLAARCEPFRAMFSHSFREADQAKVRLDYPYEVIRVLFEYLYSGRVNHANISPNVAMECVQLADQYTLAQLKTICGCILEESLDYINVIDIFTFAKYHGAINLQLACIDFFLQPSTCRRIMDHYQSAHRHHSNESSPTPPRLVYKEIIDDILNRRWKSLGVRGARKLAPNDRHKHSRRVGEREDHVDPQAGNNTVDFPTDETDTENDAILLEDDDDVVSEEEFAYGFADIEVNQGNDERSELGGDEENEEDATHFEHVENIAVEEEDSDLGEGDLLFVS
jgi:ankyrin repeat protein